MTSELISDDFNRGDQELNGSVSAEGWAWEKVTGGANFMRIDADAGKDDTPGVIAGSGISFRAYRAAEEIASPFVGCSVDVCEGSSGVYLLAKFQNSSNWLSMDYNHSSGAMTVRQKLNNVFTVLGTDTIAVPSLPYTIIFYWAGGAPGVVLNGTLVLGGDLGNVDGPSVETLLFDSYAGIGQPVTTSGSLAYDNFNAGLPWLLSSAIANPVSSADESDPNVRRSVLDEQRRANLMGGRASTILTSALGLADTVPTARVHLLGRC